MYFSHLKTISNFAYWVLLLSFVSRPLAATERTQNSSQGTLVLAPWAKAESQKLQGSWEFYWEKFIQPTDLATQPDAYLGAIHTWVRPQTDGGAKFSSFGYASYRLKMTGVQPHPKGLSILIPAGSSAMHAYLIKSNTGEILAEDKSGQIGTSLEEERPSQRFILFRLGPDFSGDLTLLIHVSNFHVFDGGLHSVPSIGPDNAPLDRLQIQALQDVGIAGVTMALGIYLFMMWFRNHKDVGSLCLTFICLGSVVRTFVTNPISVSEYLEPYYDIVLRLNYFTIIFGGPFGVQFVGRTFRIGKFGRYYRDGYFIACMLVGLSPLFASHHVYTAQRGIFQLFAISTFFFYFPVLIRSMFRREQGALLCLTGVVFVLVGIVHDILLANGVIRSSYPLYPTSFAVFLILMAQIVAQRAAKAHADSEAYAKDIESLNGSLKQLNAELENKVIERTKEVRSLLQYIPQGILTIQDEGLVGANYSAHLPVIIGQDDVAERSFRELILDRSDLSADQKDRAWQSILGCIGDSSLNFEANLANLPTQFGFKGNKQLILKCTWNIEVDDDDNIKKILVTLLDITREVESQKKLEEKNREFELIQQLIDVEPEKSKQFFASGESLLEENKRLIGGPNIDVETVKILFINMHTLKGAARTLRLMALSDCFHIVESYYADILRAGVPIDRSRLQTDHNLASTLFDRYENINRNVLGRSVNYTEISIERDFLEQNFHILKALDKETAVAHSLKEVIHNNCDKLVKMIFSTLPSVLDDVMKSANRIAKDLNKPSPIISLSMSDIFLNRKQDVALRNAMVHMLRNSLDHGIEAEDQRIAKGKSTQGKITMSAVEQGGMIHLKYQDDGAGLNIGKLRSKGIAEKQIHAKASPEEIAELIFLPGVSTSGSLSMISGRGMGMEAVRRFIEEAGGSIRVVLGEPLDSEGNYFAFNFDIQIPSNSSEALYAESTNSVA